MEEVWDENADDKYVYVSRGLLDGIRVEREKIFFWESAERGSSGLS